MHRRLIQFKHAHNKLKQQRKLQTMTIYDIKERTKDKAPYFFSKDTMAFFNQTLKDFTVKKLSDTEYLIEAPSYWGGKLMGYTRRIFNTETNDLHDAESR